MTAKLYSGDCVDVLAALDENSVDTCITDPPYELGFMGKKWDSSGVAFQPETWAAVYRVLKPGAILLAFGGTRTYHRIACAIEDAGFEIRDTIAWVYGSGFPKSYDISKGIESKLKFGNQHNTNWKKLEGTKETAGGLGFNKNNFEQGARPNNYNDQEHCGGVIRLDASTPEAQLWHGWGTALKPAFELIVVAMKPVDGGFVNNALTWGVAGLNIDGGRVEFQDDADYQESTQKNRHADFNSNEGIRVPTKGIYHGDNRPPINYEPTKGRFPANLIHDGSDEVLGLFPQTKSGSGNKGGHNTTAFFGSGSNYDAYYGGDSGSAARFFYCAKAGRSERNAGLDELPERWIDESRKEGAVGGNNPRNRGARSATNHHPTVKPLALMRYLARLTKTPTGGVVLDPFMGSGTTGCACTLEGRDFIGIEKEPEYFEIAEKRINYWSAQPPLL